MRFFQGNALVGKPYEHEALAFVPARAQKDTFIGLLLPHMGDEHAVFYKSGEVRVGGFLRGGSIHALKE